MRNKSIVLLAFCFALFSFSLKCYSENLREDNKLSMSSLEGACKIQFEKDTGYILQPREIDAHVILRENKKVVFVTMNLPANEFDKLKKFEEKIEENQSRAIRKTFPELKDAGFHLLISSNPPKDEETLKRIQAVAVKRMGKYSEKAKIGMPTLNRFVYTIPIELTIEEFRQMNKLHPKWQQGLVSWSRWDISRFLLAVDRKRFDINLKLIIP